MPRQERYVIAHAIDATGQQVYYVHGDVCRYYTREEAQVRMEVLSAPQFERTIDFTIQKDKNTYVSTQQEVQEHIDALNKADAMLRERIEALEARLNAMQGIENPINPRRNPL